ncbi:MAG: hypothetical protein K0R87_1698 [Pseudonocardia sp.]|nr:hypothetical protein [Pseudonocardia sp.]
MIVTWAVTAESIQYEVLTLGTNRNSREKIEPPIPWTTRAVTGTSFRLTRPRRAGARPSSATAATPLAGPRIQGARWATPPSATTRASGASSQPSESLSSTLENSSIVPETRLISCCGSTNAMNSDPNTENSTVTATARKIARGTVRPGSRVSCAWKSGHLHAGEQQDDPTEEGQVVQLDVGNERGGGERDLRGVALQQKCRPEDDDEDRQHDRAGDGADRADCSRGADAEQARRGGGPEERQHHHHEEHGVVGKGGVDRVGERRRDERQHRGEPGDVLGVVAPHREEAGAPAEGLLHPGVHAARARPAGAEFGRGHGDRDQEYQDRQQEQQQHRPAVLGHHRQVPRAHDRCDVDHCQREDAQLGHPGGARRRARHRAPAARSAGSSRSCTSWSPEPCTKIVVSPSV